MTGFFKKMMLAAGMVGTLSTAAMAADVPSNGVTTTYTVEGEFEDVRFALENAIVNRGLVVDYVSHIGDMLARTGADVGAKKDIYANAQSMLFCSACCRVRPWRPIRPTSPSVPMGSSSMRQPTSRGPSLLATAT